MALGHPAVSRPLPSVISAALVAGALTLAVFYHGPQIPLLAGAQALLVVWLLLGFVRGYDDGVRLPSTPLAVSLSLFWLWLAVSLTWSRVPATSMFNFWWVGSFALVFWIYTVSPERGRIWGLVARFVLAGALALAVMALVQLAAYGQPPRATFINIHSFAALLMLVVLPACAYLLIALDRSVSRTTPMLLGIAVFVLFFVIAATRGRGTTISLLIGMAAFVLLAARRTPRRHLALIVGLLGVAYLLANLSVHGIAERLLTMTDPADAALPRILIWRGSWRMVLDHPWFGTGLGTYYLAWPPYRDPADSTLGFFAHNDYLQMWIETGLPGLVLLLAVFVSVFAMMIRFLRRGNPDTKRRIEVAGLFCGLMAVAAHSFLDFNFYILPISILAGLVLGRFHERVIEVLPYGALQFRPARFVQRRAYRTISVLLAVFPLLYLVSLAGADYFLYRGFALAAEGRVRDADEAFERGERLTRLDDRLLLAHADLYRLSIQLMAEDARADREALYSDALAMLDRAERLNPYRALVPAVRGRLYQENPDLSGPDWRDLTERSYAQALALNSRFYRTRVALAQLLLASDREPAAKALLEQAVDHQYYPEPGVIQYFEMTARMQRAAGEVDKAQRLEARIEETKATLARLAAHRPIVQDLEIVSPAARSSP